jgi:hypothetical protein
MWKNEFNFKTNAYIWKILLTMTGSGLEMNLTSHRYVTITGTNHQTFNSIILINDYQDNRGTIPLGRTNEDCGH